MTLQQLAYLVAIYENDLNISLAARRLGTSQPVLSRQLALLEGELGFSVFERRGRALMRVSRAGEEIVASAMRILRETRNISRVASDLNGVDRGALSIGTTHTQARYVLPPIVRRFRARYPGVRLHIHQGTSEQIAGMASLEQIDLAIATGSEELFPHLVRLPIYRWNRVVIVPQGHRLGSLGRRALTLRALAEHPIVTYVFSLSGRASLQSLFEAEGLTFDLALTAQDSDVIKTYVRVGLGVGIVAKMAVDRLGDADLVTLDADHLLEGHVSWVGFRRGAFLPTFMLDFLELLAPQLNAALIGAAQKTSMQEEVDQLCVAVEIPIRA